MSIFQILMFAATLFFAYQIFRHVQSLEDDTSSMQPGFDEEELPAPMSESLVEQADEAYQNGHFQTARKALHEAVSLEPNNPEILNKLAFVTAKTGDVSEAIELYKRSLDIDGNDDLTHNAIASLYRTMGEREAAREHYENALRIDDAYAQTYYNYGNLLSDMGETRKAETMYLKALELQNDFSEAREALDELRSRE